MQLAPRRPGLPLRARPCHASRPVVNRHTMQVSTFLMFSGKAEQAMRFYASVLPDARIEALELYGPASGGIAGRVQYGSLLIGGTRYRFVDSPVPHDFAFTPAISLLLDVDSEEQLSALAAALCKGGKTYMPQGNYGFSRSFAWVEDRFGVSWQLNLPALTEQPAETRTEAAQAQAAEATSMAAQAVESAPEAAMPEAEPSARANAGADAAIETPPAEPARTADSMSTTLPDEPVNPPLEPTASGPSAEAPDFSRQAEAPAAPTPTTVAAEPPTLDEAVAPADPEAASPPKARARRPASPRKAVKKATKKAPPVE